jgi:hypothetical protein
MIVVLPILATGISRATIPHLGVIRFVIKPLKIMWKGKMSEGIN